MKMGRKTFMEMRRKTFTFFKTVFALIILLLISQSIVSAKNSEQNSVKKIMFETVLMNVLKIAVEPTQTNDLKYISIQYDADLDGVFEKRLKINGPISGICANGFIKCNLPTYWSKCEWYAWKPTSDFLTYQKVEPYGLKQCFCISTSCTKSPTFFHDYKKQILKSIGESIIQTLAQINPKLHKAYTKIEQNKNLVKHIIQVKIPKTKSISEKQIAFLQKNDLLNFKKDLKEENITLPALPPHTKQTNELKGKLKKYPKEHSKITFINKPETQLQNQNLQKPKKTKMVHCTISRKFSDPIISNTLNHKLDCWQNLKAKKEYPITVYINGLPNYKNEFTKVQYHICFGSCKNTVYSQTFALPPENECVTYDLGYYGYELDKNISEIVTLKTQVCYDTSDPSIQKIKVKTICTSSLAPNRFLLTTGIMTITKKITEVNKCLVYELNPKCRLKDEKTYTSLDDWNWTYTYRNFIPIQHKLNKYKNWISKSRTYVCEIE